MVKIRWSSERIESCVGCVEEADIEQSSRAGRIDRL